MKVTIDHRESRFGYPVILDDNGKQIPIKKGLRMIRREAGINRTELADIVGVSARTVEAWEQGLRNPPASALFMAKAYVDYLSTLK